MEPFPIQSERKGSSPEAREGSRKRPLILWDEALSSGRFEGGAQLQRFLPRAERTDHGAINRLVAEFGPLDHRIVSSQDRRELGLQRPIGRLGDAFARLRGYLDHVSAA